MDMKPVSSSSSQINENTANTPEPVEVVSGNSAVSFDELESVKNLDQENKGPAQERVAAKKASTTNNKGKGEEDGQGSEEKDQESRVKEVAANNSTDRVEKSAKTIKIKNGDSDLELRSDGMVSVTVNGKQEKATVQDLLDNYSGKTNWGRRFQKLGEQEASLKQSKAEFDALTKRLHEAAIKNKDPVSAMNLMGEVMNWDMDAFWKETTEYVGTKLNELANLSPEERRAIEAEEKVKRYEQRDKLRAEESNYKSAMEDLKQRAEKVMESLGLTLEQFQSAYNEAVSDGIDPNISPEDFGKHYKETQTKLKLADLVAEINGNASDDELYDSVLDLYAVIQKNPELSDEDIKEIAVEVYGSKSAKNLTRKLNKAKPIDTAAPSKERKEDPISFDDLV